MIALRYTSTKEIKFNIIVYIVFSLSLCLSLSVHIHIIIYAFASNVINLCSPAKEKYISIMC